MGDITDPPAKIFRPLGLFAFLLSGRGSRPALIDYGEVEWAQVEKPRLQVPSGVFAAHPQRHGRHGRFSAHLTAQGDLIIMNKAGLLAAAEAEVEDLRCADLQE